MFTRGECCVIAYQKVGETASPFRAVLVCSLKGKYLWATPVELIVAYKAEKQIAGMLEIPFFGIYPRPQSFLVSNVVYEGVKVKDYEKYMGNKVAKLVKSSIASMANGR